MSRHPLARPLSCPLSRSGIGRGQPLARLANRRRPLIYHLRPGTGEGDLTGELARDVSLAVLEAILFAADEPLTARRLAGLVGVADAAEARKLVARLRGLYESDGSAFQVEEVAGGFQLLTRPEFHPWLALLRREASDVSLSPAVRETLTIVAYRQPVTRADLEAIRGVGCSEVLRQLMDRGLIRIAGRDDSLGRPQLYATTKKFLQLFGLRTLRDLPRAEGLTPPRERKKTGNVEEGEGE